MTEESIASWDAWKPKDYLRDYYTEVEPDEVATIEFLSRVFRSIKSQPIALEFGCGPTLHHVLPLSPYVSQIYMADYMPENLQEVEDWVNKSPQSHSWTDFTRYTLQCEGISDPTQQEILAREQQTREKIKGFFKVDAGQTNPLGVNSRGVFPLVLSCYCADSATDDRELWVRYMRNIASLTSADGLFITTALKDCTSYKVGNSHFPSANVTEQKLRSVLELDFYPESITIEVKDMPEHKSQGYTGILLAHAIKRG